MTTKADDGTEQEINIDEIYFHEEFNRCVRLNNDIALIKLKSQGIRLGAGIQPICLPPSNLLYSPGLNCTISGWGSVKSAGSGWVGTGPRPCQGHVHRTIFSNKRIPTICSGVVLKEDAERTRLPVYSPEAAIALSSRIEVSWGSRGLLAKKGISAFCSGAEIEDRMSVEGSSPRSGWAVFSNT
uniref:Peptidase S1 domain-containing protein n=1 Tax=Timema monikensis TaxID=170555 RepID=A0A7R9E359_9NEOP|nr:unnamed protein product [Timema monikensis]